jgi:hypothetical protein
LYQALSTWPVPAIALMIAAPPFCFATFAQSTFGWNSEMSGRCSTPAILRRGLPGVKLSVETVVAARTAAKGSGTAPQRASATRFAATPRRGGALPARGRGSSSAPARAARPTSSVASGLAAAVGASIARRAVAAEWSRQVALTHATAAAATGARQRDEAG